MTIPRDLTCWYCERGRHDRCGIPQTCACWTCYPSLFSLRCLDGCGPISGRFFTRADAQIRWARHVEVPSQALHRCVILPCGCGDECCSGTQVLKGRRAEAFVLDCSPEASYFHP
jgi:hypothetical protein